MTLPTTYMARPSRARISVSPVVSAPSLARTRSLLPNRLVPRNINGWLIPVVLALALAGCAGGRDSQMTSARLAASGCRSQLTVGNGLRVRLRVTNTGGKDWPATFVLLTGAGDFTRNSIFDDSAHDGVDAGVDTFGFGQLPAGQTKVIVVNLTAKSAGNDDIALSAWGDKPDSTGIQSIPTNPPGLSCSVAINPG